MVGRHEPIDGRHTNRRGQGGCKWVEQAEAAKIGFGRMGSPRPLVTTEAIDASPSATTTATIRTTTEATPINDRRTMPLAWQSG
jgi:hypothetical protein